MDLSAIALAVLGALAGPAASIKVAAIQAGRTLEAIDKRLAAVEARVTALEHTEPEAVAKLHDDLEALGKDVGTLRNAVEILRAAEEREEKRREKAAERAERREERERDHDRSLSAKLAELGTMVRNLVEELRDVRSKLR